MKYFPVLGLALGMATPALAQQAPDAGQILQETRPPALQVPPPDPDIGITSPGEADTTPGGPTVTLQGLKLVGNTLFSDAELLAQLGDFRGQAFDLAGLRALAGVSLPSTANRATRLPMRCCHRSASGTVSSPCRLLKDAMAGWRRREILCPKPRPFSLAWHPGM